VHASAASSSSSLHSLVGSRPTFSRLSVEAPGGIGQKRLQKEIRMAERKIALYRPYSLDPRHAGTSNGTEGPGSTPGLLLHAQGASNLDSDRLDALNGPSIGADLPASIPLPSVLQVTGLKRAATISAASYGRSALAGIRSPTRRTAVNRGARVTEADSMGMGAAVAAA